MSACATTPSRAWTLWILQAYKDVSSMLGCTVGYTDPRFWAHVAIHQDSRKPAMPPVTRAN